MYAKIHRELTIIDFKLFHKKEINKLYSLTFLTDASARSYPEESDSGALGVVHQFDHLVHQNGERGDAHAVLQQTKIIKTSACRL